MNVRLTYPQTWPIISSMYSENLKHYPCIKFILCSSGLSHVHFSSGAHSNGFQVYRFFTYYNIPRKNEWCNVEMVSPGRLIDLTAEVNSLLLLAHCVAVIIDNTCGSTFVPIRLAHKSYIKTTISSVWQFTGFRNRMYYCLQLDYESLQ